MAGGWGSNQAGKKAGRRLTTGDNRGSWQELPPSERSHRVGAPPRALRHRSGTLSTQNPRSGGRVTKQCLHHHAHAVHAHVAENKRGERGWQNDF
jgi:hypothetical protein